MPSRNLVLCLDGTSNQPERGWTNVVRLYAVARKDDTQLAYYLPGLGTMGSRATVTPLGRVLTKAAGLLAGYGIRENLEKAYIWLIREYRPGDNIFIFGFSRGAFTARALAGLLSHVGLLRPGSEELAPYVVKFYTKYRGVSDQDFDWFRYTRGGYRPFAYPDFPIGIQIHFLGLWDTVNSIGWLDLRGRIQFARWVHIRTLPNVANLREALAIDERRRLYKECRLSDDKKPPRYQQMWFTGAHSDIGGGLDAHDYSLADIPFSWIVKESCADGLHVDARLYRNMVGSKIDDELPEDRALGVIHENSWKWWLLGGWYRRRILSNDLVHPSVLRRIEATKGSAKPYRPKLTS